MEKEAGFSTGVWIFLSVLLLIAVFLTGSFLSSQSAQDEQRAQQQDIQQAEDAKNRAALEEWTNKENLSNCLTAANDNYKKQWDEAAAAYGAGGKLPTEQATLHDNRFNSAQQECHNLYD